MISTISGELEEGVDLVDILRACFPMGSMTGAPKKRVLELIEKYELVQRGIFSGAVGYTTPDGNSDFNVVIRSLMYNQSAHYLSCQVGSAITWYADAAREYEECLLKVAAIRKALEDPETTN
jgi:para-aminobenzoate synthetase component 1